MAVNYQISTISSLMKQLLEDFGGRDLGVLHSVFTSSCNIKTHSGRLLTMHNRSVPLTPSSLMADAVSNFPALMLQAGQSVVYEAREKIIRIGEISFTTADAEEISLYYKLQNNKHNPMIYMKVLKKFLEKNEPNLYLALKCDNQGLNSSLLEKCFADLISAAANKMRDAMIAKNPIRVMEAVEKLLGLGPGLTPSGDDLLLGYITAVSTEDENRRLITGIKDRILREAETKTTEISYEFIYNYFQGYYARPIQKLIHSFDTAEVNDFRESLKGISLIGHSSGMDFLSGLGLGFETLIMNREG